MAAAKSKALRWVIIVVAAVVVVAVAGPVLYFRTRGDAPAPLSIESTPTGSAPSGTTPEPAVAGTWTVTDGSQAGYRVDEKIAGQSGTAVGRTDKVTGTVTIQGTTVTDASISVDMASIKSDQAFRDEQFKTRIMDVATYPTATFELTQPADFGPMPAEGATLTVKVTGDLTLHGTTKPTTIELTAARTGNAIKASGSIPVTFADFGIPNPGNAMTTTEDHGIIELLVNLRSTTPSATATPAAVVNRKAVEDLTAQERQAYVDAIHKLQSTPAPGRPEITWYEQFVQWHLDGAKCENAHGTSGAIHYSPLFLPWHREFLLKFEAALQEVTGDPTLRVPYWDFTNPASSASVFTDDFMGGMGDSAAGGAVTTGPFAKGKYELRILDPPQVQTVPALPYLTRTVGPPAVLPAAAIERAQHATHFDTAPFDASADPDSSFRNALEGWRSQSHPLDCSDGWVSLGEVMAGGMTASSDGAVAGHNMVHAMVGGTSMYQASPNDPVFWLLHANFDRLWAEWQATHHEGFPAEAAGWTPTSTMWPWFDAPINSFDSTEDHGYRYAS